MGIISNVQKFFKPKSRKWFASFQPQEADKVSAAMFESELVPERLKLYFSDATDEYADALIPEGTRSEIRANARKVFLNEGTSNHGAFTMGIHTIGTKGPQLSMIPENVPGTSSINPYEPEITAEERGYLESEWYRFSEEIDLAEHLRLAVETLQYDGEIFFQMVFDPAVDDVCFNIQQVEAKRVRFPTETAWNENIVSGIEFDGLHPKNYFVVPKTFNPDLDWHWVGVPIPAEDMIHFMIPRLPDQHRGIPWMQPVLLDIAETDIYEKYHLGAANAAARNSGGVLECQPGTSPDRHVPLDKSMTVWEPNQIKQLKPGVSYKQGNAAWPTGNYGPFIESKREKQAAGMQLTKAMLTNNFEKHNYSSFRGEMLVYWKNIQYLRYRIERMILNKIFDRWFECFACVDEIADAIFQRFRKAKRVPRSWSWEPIPAYDRSDFISSLREAVECGFMSRKMAVQELGYDWEQVEAERKEDTFEPASEKEAEVGDGESPGAA